MHTRTIAGVVFDLDGVLIDSAAAHLESWQVLARKLGRTVTEQQFLATFGRPNDQIIPFLFPEHATPEGLRRIAEEKEAIYRELVRGRLPILPGAVDLVRGCRRGGLKTAIGSSTPGENVRLALREMGVEEEIQVVVSAEDVQRGKPDPEVFLLAAERLGLPPSQCVVIEDAPAGLEAAHAAGMKVVAVATTHPAEDLTTADLVRSTVADLAPDALRHL